LKWHAIRSTPSGEFRAMLGIDYARIEVFLPVEKMWGPERKGRKTKVLRPLIPRYLFARFDAGRDLTRILEVDGVDDVLRIDGKLGYANEELVAELKRSQEVGGFDRTARHLNLTAGERLKIGDRRIGDIEGHFENWRDDPAVTKFARKLRATRAKDRIKFALANGMIMNVPANKAEKAG
jgi:transcription antitermination factor NusG